MKKFVNFFAVVLVIGGIFTLGLVFAPESAAFADGGYVYLGGFPIGITIGTDGLIVIGCADVATADGMVSPLAGADVRPGDVIVSVNGKNIRSLYEFRTTVEQAQGDVALEIRRNGSVFAVSVKPAVERASDCKRLGIMVKEDVGGVGTMTFTTESGAFAALGHPIADPESGLSSELNTGKIYNVEISGVIKGERGKAGGLQASINRLQTPIGEIRSNTKIGIYGAYNAQPSGQKIKIAAKGEAKMGHAQVFTTIDGSEPKLYDVDIVKVISQSEKDEKGLVLSVRDSELLGRTGGIVQGMSGSPIIQNGVLVGAVTHVFISDPTRGYGVHARFMLENAESIMLSEQKAA